MFSNNYYESLISLYGALIFELDEKAFCLDIKFLSKIIDPKKVESKKIEINNRKKLVLFDENETPMIDMASRFNLNLNIEDKNTRIIFIHFDKVNAAFYAQKVTEIISFNKYWIDEIIFTHEEDNPLLSGTYKYKGKEILLPNYEKILEEASVIKNLNEAVKHQYWIKKI